LSTPSGRMPWPRVAAWVGAAALLALIDQAVKGLVQSWIAPGEVVRLTSFFNLVLVFNTGAAFSFLAGASGWQREFFIAVTMIAAAVIVFLLRRHPGEGMFCLGLALILSGALGNLYDRLTLGKVVDFLDFHAFGWHWPAFNVADSAISVGAALIILDTLLGAWRTSRTAKG
jgi:signal peptidase II